MSEQEKHISEQEFERKSKQTALITSVTFHVLAMLLFIFCTCTVPIPPEELTEIQWEGSGGVPGADAPTGQAMRGNPTANQAQAQQQPVEQTQPDNIETPETHTPSVDRIPRTSDDSKPPQQTTTTNTNNQQNTNQQNITNEQQGQRVDGTGTKPASGSGGGSSGYALGAGFGTRGWLRKPSATYPAGSNATGEVVLRFTVLPNGDITNIVPISKRGGQVLADAAIAGLRKAKARPLPANAAQVPLTTTITYTFKL